MEGTEVGETEVEETEVGETEVGETEVGEREVEETEEEETEYTEEETETSRDRDEVNMDGAGDIDGRVAVVMPSGSPNFSTPTPTTNLSEKEPVDIFDELLTPEIVKDIQNETNTYANQYVNSHCEYLDLHPRA